jgi:hypothetical protein
MESARPELEDWFEKVDKLLDDELIVLAGLKAAIADRNMTKEEAQEYFQAYHDRRTND